VVHTNCASRPEQRDGSENKRIQSERPRNHCLWSVGSKIVLIRQRPIENCEERERERERATEKPIKRQMSGTWPEKIESEKAEFGLFKYQTRRSRSAVKQIAEDHGN
jgi:hypothetical protein